jgi:hypothetical protein
MSSNLNPTKALIFRIVHRENVPWILDNGLHARNGDRVDPNYRNIGNPDLIDRRSRRLVEVGPRGTLSDYVPFYFTPFSIMMYNITTGYGGIQEVSNEEIVILVSSLRKISELGIPFVFTNQHAYPIMARYFSDLAELDQVDWPLLESRDFKHDPDDPAKKERYQAEALVWKHVPLNALLGICSSNRVTDEQIKKEIAQRGLELKSIVKSGWYF